MRQTARLYNCARCRRQVIICRYCDRGNIYCAQGCARLARSENQRKARQKYQSTRAGRLANARRQQRHRDRQRQKVTHQGSDLMADNDVLPRKQNRAPIGRPKAGDIDETVINNTIVRCHFCHWVCDDRLRLDFLRSRHRFRY